jgi:hypothetical protein
MPSKTSINLNNTNFAFSSTGLPLQSGYTILENSLSTEDIMDYAALLKRAWDVTWNHKILWVFGLFAGCSSQSFQFNASGSSDSINYQFGPGEFPQIGRFLQQYREELAIGFGVLLLCMCLLMLASWILGALAQGGLIAGFSMAHDEHPVNFKTAWDQGVRFFWRILIINLIPLALGILVLLIVVGSFGLCVLPLICLAIPIALAVAALLKLASNAVVIEDLTVGEAIDKAWKIMQTQLGDLVVLGLILIVVGFIASLLIGAPFLLTAAPFLVGLVSGQQETIRTGIGFLVVCGALYIPVMIVLNALLSTFTNGAWTLAYRRWAGVDATE